MKKILIKIVILFVIMLCGNIRSVALADITLTATDDSNTRPSPGNLTGGLYFSDTVYNGTTYQGAGLSAYIELVWWGDYCGGVPDPGCCLSEGCGAFEGCDFCGGTWTPATGYESSGYFTSSFDGGSSAIVWKTFQMTKGSSSSSNKGSIDISIKASSSGTSAPTFNATGAACNFTVTNDGSSGSKDLTTCTNLGTGRYLWYDATLTTADTGYSPTLLDATASLVGVATGTAFHSGSPVRFHQDVTRIHR